MRSQAAAGAAGVTPGTGEAPGFMTRPAPRGMRDGAAPAAVIFRIPASRARGHDGVMEQSYSALPNSVVSAANGIGYAYRDTGGHDGAVPLVLLQHFRGNLDGWDPALIDALARSRRVITFDNAGVGGSAGVTADTIEQMARDAIAFVAALGIGQADLLGFSIGSFVAQEIALRLLAWSGAWCSRRPRRRARPACTAGRPP